MVLGRLTITMQIKYLGAIYGQMMTSEQLQSIEITSYHIPHLVVSFLEVSRAGAVSFCKKN